MMSHLEEVQKLLAQDTANLGEWGSQLAMVLCLMDIAESLERLVSQFAPVTIDLDPPIFVPLDPPGRSEL